MSMAQIIAVLAMLWLFGSVALTETPPGAFNHPDIGCWNWR